MIDTPLRARPAITSASRSNSLGVRLEVGSSMAMTRASSSRARAISTICRWATLSDLIGTSGRMAGSSGASAAAALRSCSRRSTKPPRVRARPRNMFCATVSSGTCWSSWWIMAIPARRASSGVLSESTRPSTAMVPLSGFITPDIVRISVDLPAPFSPRSACTSPGRTRSDMSLSAFTAGKLLLSPSRWRRSEGSGIVGHRARGSRPPEAAGREVTGSSWRPAEGQRARRRPGPCSAPHCPW